jgi:pilus assembly protein Flp/PilA
MKDEARNFVMHNSFVLMRGEEKMYILNEERGQGLLEYGLIIVLVAIIVVFILTVYGSQVANLFSRVTSQISGL